MRRAMGLGALSVLGVILFCGLLVNAWIHMTDPPGNWRNPPLYPAAQQVRVQDFGKWGTHLPADEFDMRVIKVITFTVANSFDKVESFYKKEYAGYWKPDTWGRSVTTSKPSSRLNYSWTSGGRSPSIYFVDMITAVSDSGGTDVEIGVSMFPGY